MPRARFKIPKSLKIFQALSLSFTTIVLISMIATTDDVKMRLVGFVGLALVALAWILVLITLRRN